MQLRDLKALLMDADRFGIDLDNDVTIEVNGEFFAVRRPYVIVGGNDDILDVGTLVLETEI